MKKVIITFVILLFCSPVHAAIISYDQFITPGSVTIASLNTAVDTIYQEFNGSITNVNIASDTISDDNLTPALKMSNWYDESFGDWTESGHLPATATGLTSDISAGTSYVDGARVVTSATSHTYTASKDTYVYIDSSGTFQFEEVNNGASQPTTPANSLLLAKAVTDGSDITSVTDSRQITPPNLRVYSDYRQGCVVSFDTAATVKVNAGEIDLGTGSGAGKRRNTSAISLGWSDIDTGAEAADTFYYVFAYPDPDNSSNFLGKISVSSTDATGVSNERLVGYFYNDASSNISSDTTSSYKGDGSGVPNIVHSFESGDVTTTSALFVNVGTILRFHSSGRPIKFTGVHVTGNASGAGEIQRTRFSIDGVGREKSEVQSVVHGAGATDADATTVSTVYVENLPAGLHDVRLQWDTRVSGNTAHSFRRSIVAEEQ